MSALGLDCELCPEPHSFCRHYACGICNACPRARAIRCTPDVHRSCTISGNVVTCLNCGGHWTRQEAGLG